MKRYRGVDKPPGPTLSPPPYSRNAGNKTNALSSAGSRGSNTRFSTTAASGAIPEQDLMMIRGSGAAASYLDPRTKKPVIPQAGRSIPKLKMADLTCSLAPLVESQIIPEVELVGPPLSGKGRKIRGTVSAKTSLKAIPSNDLLESFDSAIRMPDMRTINSKVGHMRKVTSLGGKVNVGPILSKNNSVPKLKSSGKMEEQNMKRLMGQLRDKYLEDMESQLGLAVERRPKLSLAESLIQDQSDDEDIKVGIPRPSTNAAEISSRIDKVVREWATESQKFTKQERAQTKQQVGRGPPINNSSQNPESIQTSKNPGKRTKGSGPSGSSLPAKNKHLAKISNAFRKSLDPITKRDVRELIGVPENDVENLEEEHDVRLKAHEAVFKNAIVGAHSFPDEDNREVDKARSMIVPGTKRNTNANNNRISEPKIGLEEQHRTPKAQPINPKLKPFAEAIGLAGKSEDGENEVYNIIKDHMNYEMASGPPKLSAPSTRRVPSTINTSKASRPTLLRSDAAGKALEKYGESQKKLQGLVNNFTQKVESSSSTKPTAGSTTRRAELELESSMENNNNQGRGTPQLSSLASQSTLNSRRDNAAAASGVISRSMRTIGRASNVAQRLGTLMSRVALRNEAYEYEKEQEAKQNSISAPSDDLPSAIASNPIKRFGANTNISPVSLMMKQSVGTSARKNPYESSSDQDLDMGRPNIPPGVSKLDSSQFDKYVEEMKKVAEKAANSFEKFKQRKDDTELVSFSEDEEDSEAEYSYGSDNAYEDAAAAAEIATQQEKKIERKQMVQTQKPSARMNVKTAQTSTRKTDSHTSPRERGAISRIMNRSSGSNIRDDDERNNNSNNNKSGDFKFVPDMSYTDQMMLQKLRKLKEQEGWGDANQRIEMGDGPDPDEIKTMIKRVGKGMPTETERVGAGPSSLNSVIRSRMRNSKINTSKK